MSVSNDYSNLWNQQQLANSNSLLGGLNGSTGSSPTIAGMDGNLIQQKALLNANSAAYRKLLEAQKTGTVKKNQNYTELMSDKYFNDNYDSKTNTVKRPTYTPSTSTGATVDSELTAGEILDDMRRLALAAIHSPDKLTSTHYDLFDKMYQKIAGNFVSGKKTDDTEAVIEDASAGTVTKNTDFHLLTDDQNFTVAGPKGEKNYNFSTGDSLQSVVNAINADSDATGVKASWAKNDDGTFEIKLSSTETGKDSFVRVDQNTGDLFAAAGQSVSGKGTDALKEKTETVVTGDDTQAALAAGVYTGQLFGDQTFTVTGAKGSQEFAFASGTSVEDVAAAINAASEDIGVKAEVIYNAQGGAEGIGLVATKAGSGQYVQVDQKVGDLFANAGKSVKVAGSSVSGDGEGPSITSLSDLGQVTVDGKTYSFADIGPGGSAALAKNPDAALAVLDQALKDIYEGRAQIKGFDPADTPMLNMGAGSTPAASTNALEIGNYGSDAMSKWIAQFIKEAAGE